MSWTQRRALMVSFVWRAPLVRIARNIPMME
jgi:hypothetical protein